jgi:glycosyltransferase involved in cell wall biosynthesis
MADDHLVLILAYHFPPENAIGAARPFRFYKYLSRMGFRCHVITAAPVASLPELDAETVSDPFITSPRTGVGWHIERSIRKVVLPGATGSQWAVHAYRAALRFLEQNERRNATVFSTYPPLGTPLAAYWLKRRLGLPWIADFRDPMADNPGNLELTALTKPTYRKLEQIFIRSADIVIANTDAAQQKLKEEYPDRSERLQLIWNGFDPEDRLHPLPALSEARRVLAHVGELYGGRDVSPVLRSIRRLIDSGRLSDRSFQVHLVGLVAPGSIPEPEFVAAAEREGWLKLEADRMPQAQARKLIQRSESLLLVQPQSAIQVPGKLFEYLQIGRPILAFVPPQSPVERILERSGVPYRCIYPNASEETFDGRVLEFLTCSSKGGQPNAWFEEEFNACRHAEKLGSLIRSIHA